MPGRLLPASANGWGANAVPTLCLCNCSWGEGGFARIAMEDDGNGPNGMYQARELGLARA